MEHTKLRPLVGRHVDREALILEWDACRVEAKADIFTQPAQREVRELVGLQRGEAGWSEVAQEICEGKPARRVNSVGTMPAEAVLTAISQ